VELTRTTATLRSLRVTASGHGIKDRTLEIPASLKTLPIPAGRPRRPANWTCGWSTPSPAILLRRGPCSSRPHRAGEAGSFRADGSLHVEDALTSGRASSPRAFDRCTPPCRSRAVLVNSIVLRLRPGRSDCGRPGAGHWLPTLPGAASLRSGSRANGKSRALEASPLCPSSRPRRPMDHLPVNGKVTAEFRTCAGHAAGDACDPPSSISASTRASTALPARCGSTATPHALRERLVRPLSAGTGCAREGSRQRPDRRHYTQRDGAWRCASWS